MNKRLFFILIPVLLIPNIAVCQSTDSTLFRINSRLSFYSYEKSGEMLLHIPQNLIYNNINVVLLDGSDTIADWKGIAGKKILSLLFEIKQTNGYWRIDADIKIPGIRTTRYHASTDLVILNYKSNEVKTDRLTGGLIVNKRPFFPFGFYTYSPVHPALPEEEVVRGFNLISPYQKILPGSFRERKEYMDRCAQLGMKVHYNLLSVSGGGGVSSKIEGLSDSLKKERLINEIIAFRDHPALLAWYIADEPMPRTMPPDSLAEIYKTIKELDPWHPVTIVFTAPFMLSVRYENALDIVMADPYPIPTSPVNLPGNVAGQLSKEFSGKKPVWIVPQAFGGGEWWEREPTIQEIRTMTYQSIIMGARGIQYFVRQGPNLFPKSTSTWAECGRIAIEIAELTPWLLSDETPVAVRSGNQNIILTSALYKGHLMIMAVNRSNTPQRADYHIVSGFTGKGKVLFENRSVNITGGSFSDQLSAYGSQVYLVTLKSLKDDIKPWPGNMIIDPGFENTASPGVPASCYARGNGDRGATYFTDTREQVEGLHSVRLVTPTTNKGIRLRFFPVNVMKGQTYTLAVWAKADPELRPAEDIGVSDQVFRIALGEYGSESFSLTSEWQQFVTNVTIPYEEDITPKSNVILQMPSAGVAWFDIVQLAKSYDINRSINPEIMIGY